MKEKRINSDILDVSNKFESFEIEVTAKEVAAHLRNNTSSNARNTIAEGDKRVRKFCQNIVESFEVCSVMR